MCTLYTIGYEGINVDVFLNSLENNGIKTLIDVREIPQSRKPGFSKSRLKNILELHNIKYIHFPQLGSPKVIRTQLYTDGDYKTFFQDYRVHASVELDTIMKLLDIAETTTVCLLCFEHNPKKCHRSVLAELLNEFSNKIDEVVNIVL
jgi:uncharacterized protein (DUF488 family)